MMHLYVVLVLVCAAILVSLIAYGIREASRSHLYDPTAPPPDVTAGIPYIETPEERGE